MCRKLGEFAVLLSQEDRHSAERVFLKVGAVGFGIFFPSCPMFLHMDVKCADSGYDLKRSLE